MKKITYLKWLQLQHYQLDSIRTLQSLVKQLSNYLYKNNLELEVKNIYLFIEWVQQQGYSLVYQKHLFWGVKNYLEYCREVLDINLKIQVPKVLNSYTRRQALESKEIKQIADWLKDKETKDKALNQALWVLFYGCGLRRTEAINLELKDVQIREKLLIVKTLKGGKKRYIPLSKKQLKTLINYIEKERPNPKENYYNKLLLGKRGGSSKAMLGKQLEYWQKALDMPHLCWHVLRHSIASHLAHQGMELEQIRQFLGHQSLASTAIYLHAKINKYELQNLPDKTRLRHQKPATFFAMGASL